MQQLIGFRKGMEQLDVAEAREGIVSHRVKDTTLCITQPLQLAMYSLPSKATIPLQHNGNSGTSSLIQKGQMLVGPTTITNNKGI